MRDVVIAAAKSIASTMPDDDVRRTQVWLIGFGDSALNFDLVVWPTLDAVKRPAAMHAAYTWAIDDALRAANIEIPFPQRDIRLRSIFGREGAAGLEAIGQHVTAEAPHTAAPARGRNDAAHDLLQSEPEAEKPEPGALPQK